MGGLGKRLRRLEGEGGEDGPSNPLWRARFSHFRRAMRRHGTLSPRQQSEAAKRLASAKPTAADRIRYVVAAEELSLGPAPESAASRAADERHKERHREYLRMREERGW